MKNDKILDHQYDGIQELDNPLPKWWLATFYATIIFSFFYIAYYHYGTAPTPMQELAKSLEENRPGRKASSSKAPDKNILRAAFEDQQMRQNGKFIYEEKCSSCHGKEAQGNIGPNLVDSFWVHGDGSLVAIADIVLNGVPEKGMPPWNTLLKPDEIAAVVAYVKGLKGSNPLDAKPPQGNEVTQDTL